MNPERVLSRRALLAASGVAVAAATAPRALSLGRTPYGGKLSFSIPWGLGSIDPHDLGDPAAALFGAALFDALYALDAKGGLIAALAETLPTLENGAPRIKLRSGLRTARGTGLDARDVVASLARASRMGAAGALASFPAPTVSATDPLTIAFSKGDRNLLARALASPLTAIVPRSFDPKNPDGTGAFSASLGASSLVLARNLSAAMGPAFLESLTISTAPDLTTSLRDFEAEKDDVGWLGSGLYGARNGSVPFDLGRAAWIVLGTSPALGSPFADPGAAQRLVDALPRARLAPLALGTLPAGSSASTWDGPPCDLLFDQSSAHLSEIATTLAAILSAPGHEVTARGASRAEVDRRRAADAVLSLGVVRPLGPTGPDAWISLATFDDPSSAATTAKSAPKSAALPARSLTSSMRTGVLGELRVTGGTLPTLQWANEIGGSWCLERSSVTSGTTP
ncbi:MAG: hypothetical protein U0414_32790 [Polyangiaceae bacterium]